MKTAFALSGVTILSLDPATSVFAVRSIDLKLVPDFQLFSTFSMAGTTFSGSKSPTIPISTVPADNCLL